MKKLAIAPTKSVFAVLILALVLPVESWSTPDNSIRSRIKIRKKISLQQMRPDESAAYDQQKAAVLKRMRHSQIADIKKFVQSAKAGKQKAELFLRLGNLYMEDYHASLAEAQANHDRQMDLYEQGGKRGTPPKLDLSQSTASSNKARTIYKDLIKKYPKHPRRDEMFYFLALTSLDKGRITEGMRYFERLAQQYPKSKYISDAWTQLGDYYFDKNQFTKAESYFNRILAARHAPLIPYSLYKKAWCAYNTERTTDALKLFKTIVGMDSDDAPSGFVRVKKEAINDIALPFTDLRLVDQSIAFYQELGDPYYRKGIQMMAGLYYESGKYKEGITLYQRLLKMDASHIDNPSFEINTIQSLMLSGQRSQAVNYLFSRLSNYSKNSSWYELNSANTKAISDANEQFEAIARKYAFQMHAEGQKTRNKGLYELAQNLYSKYLEYFPTSAEAPKVRFYLAEILFKQKQYLPAAKNYYLVYRTPTAGSLRLDAIRYSLTALDRQLNIERKKNGLAAITSKSTSKLNSKMEAKLAVIPYSEVEDNFIKISTEYLKDFPKQKDAPDVSYSRSYLQYVHHELRPAFESFLELINQYPKHATAMSAAYLVLDILNRTQDYPKLITACKKFLEHRYFKKPSFTKEVSDILRHAELKRIQLTEEEGKHKLAADQYIEYTKAYGRQDAALYEKALYNASVNYGRAKLPLLTVETQERFLRRFPNSKLNRDMYLQVAKTYESLADFDKSAYYFDKFARGYSSDPQASSAMRLAGLYYWGAGKNQQAEQLMLNGAQTWPKERDMFEKDLLDLYVSNQDINKQVKYYQSARARKGVSFADYLIDTVKIAELYGKANGKMPSGYMQEAMNTIQKYSKYIQENPAGIEAMAKVVFWFTRQKENQFQNIRLTLPQARLEANLQRKLGLLGQLEKDYSRITKLGSAEWGLAAIYRTAAIYRHTALNILTAPVPAELAGEQLEIYRRELKKQMIDPFNEKAQELAEQCLDKSQELNLMSQWTSHCYTLAGTLKPERYPLARTFYIPPLRTEIMIPADKAVIKLGSFKQYSFPLHASLLFFHKEDSRPNAKAAIPTLYSGRFALDEAVSVLPETINYRLINKQRRSMLTSSLKDQKPDNGELPSFGFLASLSLLAPDKAVEMIKATLQKDLQNNALHHLLGIAYFEQGNIPAAKVTWLSLMARGENNPAIWNNLGVVAYQEGNETQAIDYFERATKDNSVRAAFSNLGFLSVKYRNGFQAKRYFKKALDIEDDDAMSQVGLAVAQLQNREWENAEEELYRSAKRNPKDPYARLSLGYYLLDIAKKSEIANKVIEDFMEKHMATADVHFRKVYSESKQAKRSLAGDDIPDIE